jgi:hypothetical protein
MEQIEDSLRDDSYAIQGCSEEELEELEHQAELEEERQMYLESFTW